jgi:hypothetical protein
MDEAGKTALLVCDLGSDKIWQYVVDDASGEAVPNPAAPSVEAHGTKLIHSTKKLTTWHQVSLKL